uniref:B9 domain-containing protein 1 n=1 Tax=Daphnia galeata TaxID=27404 RepID=A0A8J2RYI3_9CRUS|nr:unnamed protein product [Daphnia galeata]
MTSVATSNGPVTSTPLIATSFYYSVQGQIRHGEFPLNSQLYVKTCYHHGADWIFCHGIEEGLSQLAIQKSSGGRELVWNFPLQSSWKSTNPHGWPRLIVSLYGPDEFGNDDVAYGYGSTVLPICAGHFTTTLAIYRPQSQSLLHKWTSWFTGRRPELIDPKTIALNEGRDVLRMETLGYVTVEFHTTFKDFQSLGYDSSVNRPEQVSSSPIF